MLIDNRTNGRVIDELSKALGNAAGLDMLVQSLSVFAFDALSKELRSLKANRILIDEENFTLDPNSFLLPLQGGNYDRNARNSLRTQVTAQRLYEWIEANCEVRGVKQPRTNIYLPKQDVKPTAIHGSSAFTTTGLGIRASQSPDMNTAYFDSNSVAALQQLFEQMWAENEKNDAKEQLKAELKNLAEEKSAQWLYFYTLYHVFKDAEQKIDEDHVIKSRTGIKNTRVWKKLYKFQRDGVIAAIDKIERYNGCIIADSVGLGKTFEALAIIKYYELRNDRVLVLAPKKLRENWTLYTVNDKRNLFADDRFNFDVLNHTDLTREQGLSGEINLQTLNWGNYDLIVIDESHNFRNNPPKKDGLTRYRKLMNEIIQSGVKTKVLMLSATPLNNRMNDLKNQIAFITENTDDALYDQGINSIENTLRKAQARFNQWQSNEPEQRTTAKLLENLNFDYFKLLDLLTIARSRKHIVKYYDTTELGTFPERLKPLNLKPDIDSSNGFPPLREINRDIRRLNLAAYAPLKYLLMDKRAEYSAKYDMTVKSGSVFKQVDREQSLIHLMRVNLLKRLESSVHSFAQTLQKLHAQVEHLLEKLDSLEEWEELSILDVDLEDESMEPFLIGAKVKVLIQDLDRIRWKEELQEDRIILVKLLRAAKSVQPENDAKLAELKNLIAQKAEKPLNQDNKKLLIFTAFADTASYLYQHIAAWSKQSLGLYSALVTGSGENKTNLEGNKTDLSSILTSFSPISKERDKIFPDATTEIDIIIATDCISEGQNLQDCDYVVNYDIHWNPVRIIQRFGRVDRLGSINSKIQLVNFWPNMELDEYINLEARVSGRMVLLDISATGEENVIEFQDSATMNDLEYRRRQMERLQDEVIDLEDLGSGISITDLTLTDFRMDLAEFLKDKANAVELSPIGARALVKADEYAQDDLPAGVLFCLRADDKNVIPDAHYSIAPHFLVYVKNDGAIHLPFTQTKQILDVFKQLSMGYQAVQNPLVTEFHAKTKKGHDMHVISGLLEKAITSISGKAEEIGVESLFGKGPTRVSKDMFQGMRDFEVLSYLIVNPAEVV